MTAANSQVLLVEGNDDQEVVKHLLRSWGKSYEQHFKIKQAGGVERLVKLISPQIKQSGLKTLGILIDANSNLDSRWQSISDKLRAAECNNVPPSPPSDDAIFRGLYT